METAEVEAAEVETAAAEAWQEEEHFLQQICQAEQEDMCQNLFMMEEEDLFQPTWEAALEVEVDVEELCQNMLLRIIFLRRSEEVGGEMFILRLTLR